MPCFWEIFMPYFGSRAAGWLLVAALLVLPVSAFADKQWESPPVHPIEMSPDGTRLFAVHTADHRVVIYDLTGGGLPVLEAELTVGIEPITVRARGNSEIWVVNHISDSISIIDLATMNVSRTLLVGDEPTDVVFSGNRAFVVMSQLDLVRVYDTTNLTAAPVDVPLNGADPHNAVVSNDGSKIFVSVLDSGNNTTIVHEDVVAANLGLPPAIPPMDTLLATPPIVGLIVRHNGVNWLDELARSWDTWVPYTLYDNDVVEIDATSLAVTQEFHNVGTAIFNLAVNPVTDRIYATNIEAFNEVRHEPAMTGKFAHNRVTTIDPGGAVVTPVHLNSHINYGVPAGDAGERALSLGLPVDITVNAAGTDVYVAAFGSAMVGVLDANGAITRRIAVGQGPAGLALDEVRQKLYVWCRHFSSISVVDLTDDSFTDISLGFDPTELNVKFGRLLFYSTQNSSSHGDLACATCHIFGGMDGLAWDLGDPTGAMIPAPQPQAGIMHPMKGPLITQALKGLDGSQPLHWRGDRADLEQFQVAFPGLQGRPDTLSGPDFALFKEFVFSVQYPPNPLREIDNTLQNPGSGPNPTTGENLFFTGGLVGGSNCDFCHGMPTGTSGLIFPAGSIVEHQAFESPQFRNIYEKTGFDPTQPQSVRGFGYTHAGDEPTVFSFLASPIFTFANDDQKRDVESFLFRFDSGTHSGVGQQLTMDGTNEAALIGRLNTLITEADANRIGLIAKGWRGGIRRGWMYDSNTQDWQSDRSWAGKPTTTELLALAATGTELTFTAVQIGCEVRIGLDRDNDGVYDRDEIDAGFDPADPNSTPTVLEVPQTGDGTPAGVALRAFPNPAGAWGTRLNFSLAENGPVSLKVYDVQGRAVRSLLDTASHPAGEGSETWDLRDESGRRVMNGIYFVRVVTREGTQANRLVVIR